MLVFGLALLVVAVAVSVAVVRSGDDPVRIHAIGLSVHTNGAALFVAGAVSVLLVLLSLWLLRVGLRRARRRHREIKELRQRAFEAAPATSSSTTPGQPAASPSPPPPSSSPARRAPDADDYFDTSPRD